jgi:hypothetical protein
MHRSLIAALVATACFAGVASAKDPIREKDGVWTVEAAPASGSGDMGMMLTSHVLSLPGEAFLPGRTADYENSFAGGGACITSGSNAMAAPVQLPQGATITSFKVFFSDNSAADVSVSLSANYPAGGYYFTLASLDSSGISGLGNKSTASISYPTVVDNNTFTYLVRAYSSSWSCSLRVMGAVITYTTP